MLTLNLPNKQVNAILVALDAEIEMQLGGGTNWESFPEVAALLMAYYNTRYKFEEGADEDLKTVLDFMLDYGGMGSLPNMDEGESGDKAYAAAVRLAKDDEENDD